MASVLFLLISFRHTPGDSNLYTDLVHEFAARGHQVSVATLLEAREGGQTHVDLHDGVRVLHVRCGDLFGVGPIRKGLTMLSLPRRFDAALRRHFPAERFDLVIYPTPPITFAPVVRRLKAQQGCGTYLILRDIFPQNAKDLGMIRDPLTFALFRRQEQRLYAISDHIGCMSKGNVDYVLKHNPTTHGKLEILYNWESVPSPRQVDIAAIRRQFGIEGKFTAVFGGNVGYAQELEFLLDLAACYRQRTDIAFLIVGKGAVRQRLMERATRLGLANVRFHDQLPREQFDSLLRACDVGLINLDRRFSIPNIPSKTLSYFAADLPVLAALDRSTDFGTLLEECEAGLWSITGDLNAYRANFERLLNDPELRRRLGANGRRALEQKFAVGRAYETIMRHYDPPHG